MQSFTYSDAPAGTILSETDTPSSPQSPATYTYDAKGRVTSMIPGSRSPLNYTFDASSNLTTLPNEANATNGYDKAGELTSSTLSGATTTYTYNADGQRLTAMQGSTTIASAAWNGAGELTAYADPNALMSAATYDGTGLRASATTGSGTQNFVWNITGQTPQLLIDAGNAYIYTGGLAPAEQVKLSTGTVTYLVTDLLGSVRGAVNASGSLTGTCGYDAWGNPDSSGGLATTTPFGYAGGYTDVTGLVYLINRYYEPQTGQFISVDPAISQTLEPYGYGEENPVSNTDSTGLGSCTRGGGARHYSYRHRWVFTLRIPGCIVLLTGGARAVERILAFLNRIMDRSILGFLVLLVGSALASDLVSAIIEYIWYIWLGMVALYGWCIFWGNSDGIRATITVLHTRNDLPLWWWATYGCY